MGERETHRQMRINPLSDIVVIKRSSYDEINQSGIVLPLSADILEDIGTIKFCGKGKVTPKGKWPMEVKEGDKVIFSTNGHMVKYIEGEEFIVTHQDSIIGIIE